MKLKMKLLNIMYCL